MGDAQGRMVRVVVTIMADLLRAHDQAVARDWIPRVDAAIEGDNNPAVRRFLEVARLAVDALEASERTGCVMFQAHARRLCDFAAGLAEDVMRLYPPSKTRKNQPDWERMTYVAACKYQRMTWVEVQLAFAVRFGDEERRRFVVECRDAGMTWGEVLVKYQKRFGDALTVQALGDLAKRWHNFMGLPAPKGSPGRPKKTADKSHKKS